MGAPRPAIATPLRNCYWVVPGKVLAGEHPSGSTPQGTRERLKRLIDAGVECFIDLTEPHEIKPYDAELPFSIEYLRKPIKDHGIPAQRVHMAEILDCLHDTLLSGRCVYVHCRAGIGRTGTVIGCFLVERGLAGDAALDELNRLWQQCERAQSWGSVPETDDQVKFVRGWKARAVFTDRSQRAEPTLTIDDEDPPVRVQTAPWAHLLIDPPDATGLSAGSRGSAGATPGLTGASGGPAGATLGLTPAAGGSAGEPPDLTSSPSGSVTASPAGPTTARSADAAAPALTTAAPPVTTAASRAPATPPRVNAAVLPGAANLLTDPTSVAKASRTHARPATNPTAPTQFPDDGDEEFDPLLNPEALAAASTLRARFHGALLGLAIGDAVAAATQYRRPGSFTPIGDMLGGGPFDLPRGGWSDDTAMALCLADSLLERDGFDARDQIERYRRWQQEGYLSATGQCVGITASSARAIAMAQWRRQAFSGSHDPTQLDPEPLSRVAPVVLFFFSNQVQSIEQATEAARTTCQAPAVLEACRSLAQALHAALSGQPKAVVLAQAALATAGGAAINTGTSGATGTGSASGGANVSPGARPSAHSGAPAALASAIAAFGATDNFRDAVLYAANLGGDSDVIAAVSGQLAGAYYGVKAIPTSWHNGLMRKELITGYADRLLAHAMVGMAG